MKRTTYEDDDDDREELDDREYPDEADVDDDDAGDDDEDDASFDVQTCANCGAAVYPGLERCPKCRQPIEPRSSHKPWVIVTALIVLIALLWMWFGGAM